MIIGPALPLEVEPLRWPSNSHSDPPHVNFSLFHHLAPIATAMPPSRSKKGKRKDHGIDIEALAQQEARYLIVHGEESEFLAADPIARDKAIAELYQNPNVKTGALCADTFVGPDDDPDVFLKAVDEVLDNPLRTIEQSVLLCDPSHL